MSAEPDISNVSAESVNSDAVCVEREKEEHFILNIVALMRKLAKSDSGLKVTLEADGYKETLFYEETHLDKLRRWLRMHEEGVKRISKQIELEENKRNQNKSTSCSSEKTQRTTENE